MVLNYISIDTVIGKVVRDTGIQRADLIDDIKEWLAEAMEHMNIQIELRPAFKNLTMDFHAAKVPCGCARVLAVSYCGYRLRYRNRDNDPRVKTRIVSPSTGIQNPNSVFETDPMTIEHNPVTGNDRRWPYPVKVSQMPWHEEAYYQIKGGCIWTSFPKGTVTLHYESMPVDDSGLPLVPDNMSFREAIYYHCRQKMVASGRYKDPAFNIRDLLQMYDQYASKALEEITYPTPDQMESMVDTWVRLVDANHYFRNFSDPMGPEPFYDTFGEERSLWQET